MFSRAQIARMFNYHKPDEDKAWLHQWVRNNCETVAIAFDAELPDNREKAIAIEKLEEAMFWANASIARGPEV